MAFGMTPAPSSIPGASTVNHWNYCRFNRHKNCHWTVKLPGTGHLSMSIGLRGGMRIGAMLRDMSALEEILATIRQLPLPERLQLIERASLEAAEDSATPHTAA